MKRLILGLAVLVVLVGVGRADESPLVINEFMDINHDFLADQDGDFSDWIEIYNRGDFAIDLEGWHLSDSPDDLTKWQFPSLLIGAGGHVLVFASSKDRTDPMSELHTNFKIRAGGEYLALVAPDGMTIHDYNPYPE